MKIEIRRTPKKRRKGVMARRLVVYCIVVLTIVLLWAMGLKTLALFTDPAATIDTSDVLTFAGAAFGGELLLLAFKRVFAKPSEEEKANG